VVKVIWHKAASPQPRTVHSYSPGGANVLSDKGTLAPPGKYDWTCVSFGKPETTTQMTNRSLLWQTDRQTTVLGR